MKILQITRTRIWCVCALFLLIPLSSQAQYMGGMGGGMGMGPYSMGMGMYGPGGMGGMDTGPTAMVTVKYGEKVYDAIFGDLVEARILYVQVPADAIGVHYFDDGTHGDEVPFDGMPSNIIENRDTYLGPFAIKYKNMLEKAYEAVQDMGALRFYNLSVATDDETSQVAYMGDWKRRMDEFLDGSVVTRIEQFKGYDDETYIKAIDPAMFESMEGMSGMSGGYGIGSMIPDLPPPPGLPNLRDQQFGQTGEGEGLEQTGEGAETGRYDPLGRVNQTLQATEAMNQLP
ncbi:MAG: hypothetical protein JXR73_05855 [Candidatus Omnitrophica bacterium]|nr:hypothetical protein [Candidatus Omnitrophota bacterium]